MTLAERMIVMNAGRMEQIGTPDEVYHRPATTFVAGFIGSPPMNLVRGRAEGAASPPAASCCRWRRRRRVPASW
jgi:sn-glycerol 3-phosphate transport system ATP-binding protein